MSQDATERAAAIASLLVGQSVEEGASAPVAPPLARTGNTVEAGGEEARLLIKPAHLSYLIPNVGRQYVDAVVGDVVLLTKGEANRLDELAVTVSPDADLDDVEEDLAGGLLTDEQIKTGGAEDLVAYVTQHPDERDRVAAIEGAKPKKKQRATVLAACERDEEAEAEALLEAERRAEDAARAAAEAEAEAQQSNTAPGADSDTNSSE